MQDIKTQLNRSVNVCAVISDLAALLALPREKPAAPVRKPTLLPDRKLRNKYGNYNSLYGAFSGQAQRRHRHKCLTFMNGPHAVGYPMPNKKPFPEAPEHSTLRKVQPGEYGHLLERVQVIAKSLSIPAPDVWAADSNSLQAEAFPSNNVAITTGMLKLLNEREQSAVLAHELGHRKNGDKDGIIGNLQIDWEMLKGHLPEHRETLADARSVEAAYASKLYSPDDLARALTKMAIAGKTAGHDISALNGSLAARINGKMMGVFPEKLREEINSIGDSMNNLMADLHLNTHPTLQNRIENINELKQAHDRTGKIR